ncbi:hypothetical protein [Saccharothrix sp. HUAS TT1]|uniref:hypothetical protein n=1 Tax=unclassified Saccharothrix TaxID=2593673 RepID=UPI00345B7161
MQISIGAQVVTKARVEVSGAVECRRVGAEAVLSFAGGALEVVLTEPALEKLVDEAQGVFDTLLEQH